MRMAGAATIARSLRADMLMFKHRSFAPCLQQTSPSRVQRSVSSSQTNCDDGMPFLVNNIQNRVPKTLYRQLLSWCRRYDDVTFNPLPPVTVSRPQVNHIALKNLKEIRSFLNTLTPQQDSSKMKGFLPGPGSDGIARFGTTSTGHLHPAHHAMYTNGVEVKDNMVTFPEIRNANELRAIIRSVYWLNNKSTISNIKGVSASEGKADDEVKEQVSLAFDAMKSCNELSPFLESRRSKRETNILVRQTQSAGSEGDEFPHVKYHIGQVVKHNSKSWRGVIVGWDIVEKNKDDGRLSSLTTKQYTIPHLESDSSATDSNASSKDDVSSSKYTVIVDINDAQGNNRHETDEGNSLALGKSIEVELQGDLSPVDDPCLQRVHSSLIKQYFTKFDSRGHFVPNNILKYIYPLDCVCEPSENIQTDTSKEEINENAELEMSCLAITEGVHAIGSRLLVHLSESPGQKQLELDADASLMISSLKSSVQLLLKENASPHSAISLLAKLYAVHVKINALLWKRNANQGSKQHINFSLGQIVKHKVYGFRGIVAAWDSKPRMDVSNWDGLKDVDNPSEKPFYHIYPDVNDCITAFGGPRHFRYVCQENLELSLNEQPLELYTDLDQQEWKWDRERGRYRPSIEMKFMFAEDLGGHETSLIATVQNLKKTLTQCLLEIRDADRSDLFSMDDLFCQLQLGANTLEDATIVQDFIKEIWKETSNCDSRHQLDNSISYLLAGKHEKALTTLSNIVASDPSYGEAWNKKATVHYMMGDARGAIKAAEEALKIDKRNFQALAGIGLIEMDSSHYDKAESVFRKCLAINPWLVTVSSRLSAVINSRSG